MNYIDVLMTTRARLISQKDAYRREYEERCRQIDERIKAINEAVETISGVVKPYLCQRCNGSGSIRVPDAAGQMEDQTCSACKGTGVRMNEGGAML